MHATGIVSSGGQEQFHYFRKLLVYVHVGPRLGRVKDCNIAEIVSDFAEITLLGSFPPTISLPEMMV